MIVLTIILGIFLILSILLNILFIKNFYLLLFSEQNNLELLQKEAINSYKDVIMLLSFYAVDKDNFQEIIDLSSYEKNNVIGLTIFAQKQLFIQMAQEMGLAQPQQALEFLQEGVLIPHSNIYELKDGSWIWT